MTEAIIVLPQGVSEDNRDRLQAIWGDRCQILTYQDFVSSASASCVSNRASV